MDCMPLAHWKWWNEINGKLFYLSTSDQQLNYIDQYTYRQLCARIALLHPPIELIFHGCWPVELSSVVRQCWFGVWPNVYRQIEELVASSALTYPYHLSHLLPLAARWTRRRQTKANIKSIKYNILSLIAYIYILIRRTYPDNDDDDVGVSDCLLDLHLNNWISLCRVYEMKSPRSFQFQARYVDRHNVRVREGEKIISYLATDCIHIA